MKIYKYIKSNAEENISQEIILKNIDETRNYFVEEIEQIELISIKHIKVCSTLNYIEHFLILASVVTGCISISITYYSNRSYELFNRNENFCSNCRN